MKKFIVVGVISAAFAGQSATVSAQTVADPAPRESSTQLQTIQNENAHLKKEIAALREQLQLQKEYSALKAKLGPRTDAILSAKTVPGAGQEQSSTNGVAAVSSAATSAYAADMPVKARSATVASNDWTGAHLGFGVGGRWASTTWRTTSIADQLGVVTVDPTTASAGLDSLAFRINGYIGYDYQIGPRWVLGAEVDFGWADNHKTISGIPGSYPGPIPFPVLNDSVNVKESWDSSFRGRLGFLITPAWLIYATGGVAVQHVDATVNCATTALGLCTFIGVPGGTFNAPANMVGWTAGGGVDVKLGGNWLARAEYRYSDYGSFNATYSSAAGASTLFFQTNIVLRTQTALLGISYKFD